eukprot:TRINITY_DN1535_c0_g1_i1.p1 TRINITY_DN1535_c0_g1~~TRINITY_DN1535_c0_g1_i1.p1  ORF type:complete len:240 (-),score=99.24 TRINITY_DN1535_c0_g1_i1:8-727(-)
MSIRWTRKVKDDIAKMGLTGKKVALMTHSKLSQFSAIDGSKLSSKYAEMDLIYDFKLKNHVIVSSHMKRQRSNWHLRIWDSQSSQERYRIPFYGLQYRGAIISSEILDSICIAAGKDLFSLDFSNSWKSSFNLKSVTAIRVSGSFPIEFQLEMTGFNLKIFEMMDEHPFECSCIFSDDEIRISKFQRNFNREKLCIFPDPRAVVTNLELDGIYVKQVVTPMTCVLVDFNLKEWQYFFKK